MTTTISATGSVAFSDIKNAFPGIGNSLRSYLSQHPSLPSTGSIDFFSFRGLTAVSPIHDFTVSGTKSGNLSMNGSGYITGAVSASSPGNLTVYLGTFVKNSAYQKSLTYSIQSGSYTPSGLE